MSSISEISSRDSGGSEDEEGPEGGASSSSLMISRVVLSIVASIVLWGTSLSMVNQVVYSENVLPLPALADVYQAAMEFVNATQKEGNDYKTCVLSQLGNCNRTLQSQLNSELQRVQVGQSVSQSTTTHMAGSTWPAPTLYPGLLVRVYCQRICISFFAQGEMESNRERVALGRLYEGNCTHMWWSTLEAVIYWQENRPYMIDDDPEDAFTDACTREERDYLLVRA